MANATLKLKMVPPTGERLLRFVGDRVRFSLRDADGKSLPDGWRGWLRTNLGHDAVLRREIIASRGGEKPLSGASWRDVPMRREGNEWAIELALTEVGYFKVKAYAVDERGWQVWPGGGDLGISVHPDSYRTANTIYCAFTRLFGETKTAFSTADRQLEAQVKQLDKRGYAVIPPSGKLRDLVKVLPHIIDTLGCRILHLLPINPTPTTNARFGRYGSPYAGLDLTAIDPALVEFDRRTTAVEQFGELAHAVHAAGARLFLDLVVNHTGWSSTLHEHHPEWFLRQPDGAFVSPGAWGVTWEDLVELDTRETALWDELAAAFLTWCRRGVHGFRCDAGYKVPLPVWQHIAAHVREEFPETLFLLEGLGGGWNETEALLTEGGMQWAYSELFQEISGREVAGYLDHAHKQSRRVGLLAHYSETHDNDRLAKKGRAWSLLRNRLCALASANGAFGFACGVEWLSTERILVHGCSGLAWGNEENLIPELAQLNKLLAEHPCFFDGAQLARLSPPESPVLALQRVSADGQHVALVLVNTDVEKSNALSLGGDARVRVPDFLAKPLVDLLGQSAPKIKQNTDGTVAFALEPGACHCLAPAAQPRLSSGEAYRRARAQAAWAIGALREVLDPEEIGRHDWRALVELAARDPNRFVGSLAYLDKELASEDLVGALNDAARLRRFPQVVIWSLIDRRRIMSVPPNHWLLVQDDAPFRVTLRFDGAGPARHAESVAVFDGHIACFAPCAGDGEAELIEERYGITDQQVSGAIRFLAATPVGASVPAGPGSATRAHPARGCGEARTAGGPNSSPPLGCRPSDLVLLTNGIGGMARLCVDLGRVTSKYDCLLGANLDPGAPGDRHIFAKRVRVWANAHGFISGLNADNLVAFEPGPPAHWKFAANAGDGRVVEIEMAAGMVESRNTTLLRFRRERDAFLGGSQSDWTRTEVRDAREGVSAGVRLTVRVDIEDRNFHWETKRNGAAEHHFSANVRPLRDRPGFAFTPAPDRQLQAYTDAGVFQPEPEWCENIPHPVEASRGQVVSGDAFSPGWFDMPLLEGETVTLAVTADPSPAGSAIETSKRETGSQAQFPSREGSGVGSSGNVEQSDLFLSRLLRAARAFVVRRGEGKTVIAGYPWFLDWGRDTLICARGFLAAGMTEVVKQILVTFARFEENGTLPNTIHGQDASNRDTSDAPLWFGIVCEEMAARRGEQLRQPVELTPSGNDFYSTVVDKQGRTTADVLRSIARNYRSGTPNGIRMDPESALIWSPSHFTWMDTNFPAATPREGYPVEIQVLWVRLLRQLERIEAGGDSEGGSWGALAMRAQASLEEYFWLEDRGYLADLRIASPGKPASASVADAALRSNGLLAVSMGLVTGQRAQRCVAAALRYLLVPGALRSLAPLPVSPPLPVYNDAGGLLNNPIEPYFGRYEGDEDTRRKPAYHNGTAWTWTFPIFCEALARAWDFSPESVAAARAYLGSMDRLMNAGCLGHIPEIVDGDAPHLQRGCDAQAWGVTEALRVWSLLKKETPET